MLTNLIVVIILQYILYLIITLYTLYLHTFYGNNISIRLEEKLIAIFINFEETFSIINYFQGEKRKREIILNNILFLDYLKWFARLKFWN